MYLRQMKKMYSAFILLLYYVESVHIQSFSVPYFPTFGRDISPYSPYSVQMMENTDQKNSEYGLFSRSFSHSELHQPFRSLSLTAFTCSKLAIEALEQGVKFVQS